MFAQGFIKKIKKENKLDTITERCSYKDEVFNNYSELEKYIHKNVIPKKQNGKKINIRQYIRHTLNDNREDTNNKNVYFVLSIINKTYDYCIKNNIEMTDEFLQKRIELNN